MGSSGGVAINESEDNAFLVLGIIASYFEDFELPLSSTRTVSLTINSLFTLAELAEGNRCATVKKRLFIAQWMCSKNRLGTSTAHALI